jgi:hypothetical protein
MQYVFSGRVIHIVSESDNKATLCGKFIRSYECRENRIDFLNLLCKRCARSLEKKLKQENCEKDANSK